MGLQPVTVGHVIEVLVEVIDVVGPPVMADPNLSLLVLHTLRLVFSHSLISLSFQVGILSFPRVIGGDGWMGIVTDGGGGLTHDGGGPGLITELVANMTIPSSVPCGHIYRSIICGQHYSRSWHRSLESLTIHHGDQHGTIGYIAVPIDVKVGP